MRLKHTLSLILSAVLAIGMLVMPMSAAQASGRVQISSPAGSGQAYVNKATTVTLNGRGFQSINKGFGGIYVLFGWVGNGWRPSQGGVAGTHYKYVPDSESKNNRGYMKFVSFPGSETQDAANGGLIDANGNWSTTLTIPGPIFVSVDRNGKQHRVDCRQVQCGIITIGAHGVKNPSNESFTPIKFVGGSAPAAGNGNQKQQPQPGVRPAQGNQRQAAPAPRAGAQNRQAAPQQNNQAAGQQPANPAAANPAPGADSNVSNPSQLPDETAPGEAPAGDEAAAAPGLSGKPTVGLLDKNIMQGKVLSFTAQGFTPGEQVVATLDTGTAAAGPFIAGQLGDLASTVPLEPTIRPGTHVLTLTGAVSKTPARVTFTVDKNEDLAANINAGSEDNDLWGAATIIASLGIALVAIVLLVSAVTALIRKKKTPPAATAAVLALALVAGFGLLPTHGNAAFADEVDVTVTIPERDGGSNPGEPGKPNPGTPAPGQPAPDDSPLNPGQLEIDNAALRWGINPESSSGSFFGGCNFLVAGKVGDLKSSHVWSKTELAKWYQTEGDHVQVLRGDKQPGVDERCVHADGSKLTTGPNDFGAGTEALLTAGKGALTKDENGKVSGKVNWPGSFSVVFYGGMTYWWASDLQLDIAADSSAKLTALVGGYGSSMEDTSKWEALAPRRVTLAEFKDVKLTKHGFTATPTYAGRDVSPAKPVTPQDKSLEGWGSFPIDFIKFHNETGQSSYWYTSGGIRDKAKSPSPLTVSWDAATPIAAPAPTPGNGGVVPGQPGVPGFGLPDPGSFLPAPGDFLPAPGDSAAPASPLPGFGNQNPAHAGSGFIPNPAAANGYQGWGNGGVGSVPAPLQPGYVQPPAPTGGFVPTPTGLALDPAQDLTGLNGAAETAATGGNVKQLLAKAPQWVGQNLIPATKAVVANQMPTALTLTGLFLVLLLITAAGFKAGWLIFPGTRKQEPTDA